MTTDVIKGFNRDTAWLATGVLGTVVFAALLLAFQERQPKATQAEGDLLLNANPATVANVVARNSNSNGKMTAEQGVALITRSLKLLHRNFLPHRRNLQFLLRLPFLPSFLK